VRIVRSRGSTPSRNAEGNRTCEDRATDSREGHGISRRTGAKINADEFWRGSGAKIVSSVASVSVE
jgi:hypothetical protein